MFLGFIFEKITSVLDIFFIFCIRFLSKENFEFLVKLLFASAKILKLDSKLFQFLFLIFFLVDLVEFIHLCSNFFFLLLVSVVDLHNLFHVLIVLELIIATMGCNFAFFHDNNSISEMNKIDCMSYKNSGSIFEDVLEYL